MKVIYPEETLALLAKYDESINYIMKEYQRNYPEPPDFLRKILGEEWYTEKYREVLHQRRRGMLEDPYYQACIQAKAKIISLSPCTYQFDVSEVSQFNGTTKPATH